MTLKNQIEALLFSAGRYIGEEDLVQLTQEKHKEIHKALHDLKEDYEKREGGLRLQKEGNSWKLNVAEKYVSLVTKIVADTELPMPVLETLSMIAYKAPVLQSEIINTRGTHAYDHISELLEKGFVSREKFGRSFKLRIAEKFLEYFDIEGEKDIKEMLQEVKQKRIEEEKEKAKKRKEKLAGLEVVNVEKKEETQTELPKETEQLGELDIVEAQETNTEETSTSEETETEEKKQ